MANTPKPSVARLEASSTGASTMLLLVLLFLSSIGEVYFPDVMKLNQMPARTNWMFLAHALGNTAVGIMPRSGGESLFRCNWGAASVPALMDIASYAQLFAGVALAGAQTKSILYSSSLLWAALLSKAFLGKTLSTAQWSSILLLFGGLCLKSFGGGKVSGDLTSSSFLTGVCLVLGGCFTHALVNVKNEGLIGRHVITPKSLCVVIGVYAVGIWSALYMCGVMIPEKEKGAWVYASSHFSAASLWADDRAPGLPMSSGSAWLGFVLSTAVHAGAFFSLLGSVGTVTSGIVKGATVATYVLISGAAFCSVDGSYCLNWRTLGSAAVCGSSVLCYSMATAHAKKAAAAAEAAAVEKTPADKLGFDSDELLKASVASGIRARVVGA